MCIFDGHAVDKIVEHIFSCVKQNTQSQIIIIIRMHNTQTKSQIVEKTLKKRNARIEPKTSKLNIVFMIHKNVRIVPLATAAKSNMS